VLGLGNCSGFDPFSLSVSKLTAAVVCCASELLTSPKQNTWEEESSKTHLSALLYQSALLYHDAAPNRHPDEKFRKKKHVPPPEVN